MIVHLGAQLGGLAKTDHERGDAGDDRGARGADEEVALAHHVLLEACR